jgi:preprotein translocase subunit SecG
MIAGREVQREFQESIPMLLAAVDWLHYMFMVPLALISIFLILVILVQRGRGGGLTGALGGMGGASAFGTKAGDLFTKITIAVAFVWIVLSMASLKFLNQRSPFTATRGTGASSNSTTTPGSGSSTTKPSSGAPAKAPGTGVPAPAPSGGSTDSGAKPAKPATTTP